MATMIETNWNELWPIVNIMNEVCHGIKIHDMDQAIGYKYEIIVK